MLDPDRLRSTMVFIEARNLRENMVLGREIQKGDVLLERGTLLTQDLISNLRQSGVPGVDVDKFPERIVRERRNRTDELQVGQELTRNVVDMSGRIILRRGTVLDDTDLEELQRWMIKSAWVKHEVYTRAGAMMAQRRDRLLDARKRGILIYRSQIAEDPPVGQIVAVSCALIALILAQAGIPPMAAAAVAGLIITGGFVLMIAWAVAVESPQSAGPAGASGTAPSPPATMEAATQGTPEVCPACGAGLRIAPQRCHACGHEFQLSPDQEGPAADQTSATAEPSS